MAASNFAAALPLVLAHEGGYVNHPKDPGGATNFGVTQKTYSAYRRVKKLADQSVKLIAYAEVVDIYAKDYWQLCGGDSLPVGLDYAVFDFAVNSGVSRAVRYLQRLVGTADDAVLGSATLSLTFDLYAKDEESLIARYCANRMAFLQSLSTFPTFGKGWARRVIGYRAGVQPDDTGVIDFATMQARHDLSYPLPKLVENSAKAFSDDYSNWPIAKQNDYLALMIAK